MRPVGVKVAAVLAALGGSWCTQAAHATEYATVVSTTPVTATVSVPRQVCTDTQELVQPAPSGAGAVIGAIAGGVLGHTVGGGFGQAAATGVGAVAGAAIGNQVEANSTPPAQLPVRRCQTVSAREGRVVAYDVVYDYGGQRYSTRMGSDPGRQFAVSVQPGANGAAAVPVPAEPDAAPQSVPAQPLAYADAPQASVVYGSPYYYGAGYYAPYYPAPVVGIGLGFGYYGGWHGGRWR